MRQQLVIIPLFILLLKIFFEAGTGNSIAPANANSYNEKDKTLLSYLEAERR